MNMDERIARINELYHKSQKEGLTPDEKDEQKRLREEYIASVRGSLKSQLNNVDIVEKDGSVTNLGEKFADKPSKSLTSKSSDDKKLLSIRNKKSQLRSEFLKKRDAMSEQEIEEKSKIIQMRLFNEDIFKEAETILLYASYGSEPQTAEIFNRAVNDGKKVAFPKCINSDDECFMEFYEVSSLSMLKAGYKGILEPDTDSNELTKVSYTADLCIVPGCVFTRSGHRIGYGKGYYDRAISSGVAKKYAGITYKSQLTHKFETEETDMCVDCVITEENIYVCK